MGKISEKLINFAVYNEGNDMLGLADIDLPDLEFLTETVSGAGIAGELDSPVIGHLKSLEIKLKFRTVNKNSLSLIAPKTHQLDMRGAIQTFNTQSGEYETVPVKVVAKAVPKKGGLGKFEPGKAQDNESTFEASYLKVTLDGADEIEIDKFNYICKVGGVDYLADVRTALGK